MPRINYLSFTFDNETGYGRWNKYLVRELAFLGLEVHPGVLDELNHPSWLQRMQGRDFGDLTITCAPGDKVRGIPGRQWVFSMTEDTKIPLEWVENLNGYAERVIVPCEQNAEAFARCGVTVPVHVVNGGTSPEDFPVIPKRHRAAKYTVLCLADRGIRKGIETSLGAFFQAFPSEGDVRLLIKARPDFVGTEMRGAFINQPRLSFWLDDVDSMADVYAQADVFLYPAYGDGWGMPPREAAMMGLPVIATAWSGTKVGLEHWGIPLTDYEMSQSMLPQAGKWAKPNVHHVAQKLRWCYENRDAARAIGLAGAKWLRENQTWAHTAKNLLTLFEEYAGWQRSPLNN